MLITGGSGFIGRNLAEHYSATREVLVPAHGELDLLDEDAVRRYLTQHDVDVVVHSATKPGHRNAPDTTGLFFENTRMFFNLVRCSDLFGVMLFASSGAVYDMRHYQPKMPESYFDAHVPMDEHGFAKYVAAKHIEKSSNVTELRIFGVFGPHEDYAIRFISNAICKALFGLPITLRQNRRFDYLYVADLPPVIDHFASGAGSGRAYNVTPDSPVELLALAELVRSVSGADVPILVGAPGEGVEYSGSNERLRAEMPELRLTPVEAAVRSLYEWYARRRDQIDRNALLVDK